MMKTPGRYDKRRGVRADALRHERLFFLSPNVTLSYTTRVYILERCMIRKKGYKKKDEKMKDRLQDTRNCVTNANDKKDTTLE
jgi:hypothetical protein